MWADSLLVSTYWKSLGLIVADTEKGFDIMGIE
jgi:hypothetical protein